MVGYGEGIYYIKCDEGMLDITYEEGIIYVTSEEDWGVSP